MNIQKKNKNSGFTLLEVMVTVAIIAVAIGIAVPNLIGWLPKYRLKSAARDMVSFMQQVKLEAIKTNTTLRIVFDNSGSPGFYYLDSNQNGNHDPGEQKTDLSDYGSGVSFGWGSATNDWNGDAITTSVTNNPIGFSSRGGGSSCSIFLNNGNGDTCYAITILTIGSINIREWTGASWSD